MCVYRQRAGNRQAAGQYKRSFARYHSDKLPAWRICETSQRTRTVEREGVEKKMIFGGTVETAGVAVNRGCSTSLRRERSVTDLVVATKREGPLNTPGIARELPSKSLSLIRHHIGLQTLEETKREGTRAITFVDIISLAPDQNCQQWFFHPENMSAPRMAPRCPEKRELRSRRRTPLVRSYSHERAVEVLSLFKETLNNAWAAIPLTGTHSSTEDRTESFWRL